MSDAESSFTPAIGVDTSHPQTNQSWIIENDRGPGLLDLEAPASTSTLLTPLNTYVNGNHMIRARYTVIPGCIPAPTGLVSWWRAEGNAKDAVSSNQGTLLGNTTYSPRKAGNGFLLDGNGDGVNVGNPGNLQVQDLTIEAWIKRASASVSSLDTIYGPQGGIFYYGQGGYGLSVEPDGRLHFTKIGVNNVQMLSGGVTDTNWHHVAVTKAGSAVVFYVDGVAYPVADPYEPGFTFVTSAAIGTRGDGLGNTFFGSIDELAIFNRALTAAEIQSLYGAGKCVPPDTSAPAIEIQPADQLRPAGGLATFAVVANGASPLSYQWFFDGHPLANRTNAAFTLANIQAANGGLYFVTITNANGAVTSSVAHLGLLTLPPPVCRTIPTGAVAWWRAQSNGVDSIGINDLLLPGDAYSRFPGFTTGKVGAAFQFLSTGFPGVSSNNYSMVPQSADLNVGTNGLTIEGWIRPSPLSGQRPILEWNDSHGNIGADIALNGSSLEGYLTDTNGPAIRRIVMRTSSGVAVTSTWQHVALSLEPSAGWATLYFNGVAIGRTNLGAFVPATQAPLFFAYRPSGSFADSYYLGAIDEMAIYNRGLSAAEVGAIVSADSAGKCVPAAAPCAPLPSGAVSWWRGEQNGLDSVDGNTALLLPTMSYSTGIVGRAFAFATGYVRIAYSSNLNVGAGPGLTIEAWVQPDVVAYSGLAGKASRELIGWHSGSISGVRLSITNIGIAWPTPLTPVWVANLVDVSGVPHFIRSPPGLPAVLGLWQHVALTYDKATGEAALYLNGNPVTQTNLGIFTPQTAADLNLGYQTVLPLPRFSSSGGAMDEVALYARALGPAEIRSIMLARGNGKCKAPPSIVAQPLSVRVNEGGTAVLSVMAEGNPLLRYQWRWNSTNLTGATTATLILTNVQMVQTGAYSVRITNAFGAVVSSNAFLTLNRSPVADATATRSLVTVPFDCMPLVILDGSRSSDADADPLRYFWFNQDQTTLLATGLVATVSLPPGNNALLLMVTDGQATNIQRLIVEVITTQQALDRLMDVVRLEATRPLPLLAPLAAAADSLERHVATSAVNQLQAFENQVRFQVSPPDPAAAEKFLGAAHALIDLLVRGCSSRPHGHAPINVRHGEDGWRIQFTAAPGFSFIVETSTNLSEWQQIGVASENVVGEYEFLDANWLDTPNRFYRITIPFLEPE